METVKRSADEWRGILEAWRVSGLSQRAWCEAHGVSYASFTKWAGKLKKRVLNGAACGQEPKAGWAELSQTAVGDAGNKIAGPPDDGSADRAIRIEVGKFCVVVDGGFEDAALLRVLRVVAGLC